MGGPADSEKLSDSAQRARYDASVRHLQFELDLFWKRSLFFWVFIAAAFTAFTQAEGHAPLQMVIASFGFVCSVVLTLANRGSKYWYESWETKLKNAEKSVTGPLFGLPEPEKPKVTVSHWLKKWSIREEGQWWFKGKRYSPSKLAIALSDYVAVIWLCLLVSRIPKILTWPPSLGWFRLRNIFIFVFVGLSIVYGFLLRWLCRSEHSTIE